VPRSYTNTSACISRISFIDGERGILRYRGYPIEELAERSTFLETAYLVLFGELPTQVQSASFSEAVMRHCGVPDTVAKCIDALPHDAHPMGSILVGLTALSTCHPEQNPALAGNNIYRTRELQDKQIVRLVGKIPTLAALAYHKNSGRRSGGRA
jgi:citrate synthase